MSLAVDPVDYLLIGHLTADVLPNSGRALGGTVSYAARTAHAFGLRVGVLTSCPLDEPLLSDLRPYAQIQVIPAPQTTTFENIYRPEGRQQYLRARAGLLTPQSVPVNWQRAPCVHLAPVADEFSGAFGFDAPNQHTLLTLQGLLRRWDDDQRVVFKTWSDALMLNQLDHLVLSEEDIAAAPDLEAQYVRLCRHVVVTRGEHGGTSYVNGIASEYETPVVDVVHPTGAGDVFATSLLATLHLKRPLQQALRVAARLAATCVTRYGMEGCPTPTEVRAALS